MLVFLESVTFVKATILQGRTTHARIFGTLRIGPDGLKISNRFKVMWQGKVE